MDPLSITSAVLSITAKCVSTTRDLYALRDKYKSAGMTISAIYSESTVISASLSHIQSLNLNDSNALSSKLQSRPELEATFDTALTGCALVFSVLDEEVQKLCGRAEEFRGKAAYMWKEETMKELLVQIRGQQTGLTLLIQALQMGSVSEIKALLVNNNAILEQVARRTRTLRKANPRVKAPVSIFEASMDDIRSIYSMDSTASSTDFEFDDLLVNSRAYRNALTASRSHSHLNLPATAAEETSDSATIVGTDSDAPVRSAAQHNQSLEPKTDSAQELDTENKSVALSEHSSLLDRYKKVKMLYFEKVTEVNQLKLDVEGKEKQIQAEVEARTELESKTISSPGLGNEDRSTDSSEFKSLLERYKKVKMLYFEKVSEIDKLKVDVEAKDKQIQDEQESKAELVTIRQALEQRIKQLEENDEPLQNLQKDFENLKERYTKVKRFFFEKVDEVNNLEAQMAEKVELEKDIVKKMDALREELSEQSAMNQRELAVVYEHLEHEKDSKVSLMNENENLQCKIQQSETEYEELKLRFERVRQALL